jgi:deoxyribonucleoside regulator
MGEWENTLLARIAWMYYIQGMTQQEIGERLHYSRTKVTRLLAKAQETGIVDIRINSAFRTCFDTEEKVRAVFQLKEVIVVPTDDDMEITRVGVGHACAYYLAENLEDGDILGCAWGRSLYEVGRALRPQKFKDLRVVQLMGGLNSGAKINPQQILEILAAPLHATGIWLPVPAVVDSPHIQRALLEDEGVRRVLELGRSSSKALLGLGDVTPTASLIASGALKLDEMEDLKRAGAVGDMLGRFYDKEGRPVEHEVDHRVVAISLDEVRGIPLRIGVTCGVEKAAALLGAIWGGYLNVLVVDEATALETLRMASEMRKA